MCEHLPEGFWPSFSCFRLLMTGALFLLLESCTGNRDKLITETVQQRVTEFREKKKQECRKQLLRKAEIMVDSLLLAEAQAALQDSLARSRPFRPEQPPTVLPVDSFPVSPVFQGNGNAPGN